MPTNNEMYYQAIKKALEDGNAAVMVGAGFSLNAGNGEKLALWKNIVKVMHDRLEPDNNEPAETLMSRAMQIGQQFEEIFGRSELDTILKNLIPDDSVYPSDLHKKLLELPWTEILTTNYDTLLERAATQIVNPPHYTVATREDIPRSKMLKRRRIVKLNGSFPSHRPFIFTEEDFRKYDTEFAPFVNLVRQVLFENILCLVGFSGDDPNFLNWIGWVKDMLKKHKLPIYFITDKQPSVAQQKLLETRGITIVTLPVLEGSKNDYAGKYAEFLKKIKPAPYNVNDLWELELVINEGYAKNIDEKKKNLINVCIAVIKVHEKYPHWLIAPRAEREKLQLRYKVPKYWYSDDVLDDLVENDPILGVIIFSEHAWCYDILLLPLYDGYAEVCLKLLEQTVSTDIERFKSEIDKEKNKILKDLQADTSKKFHKYWCYLALALLRWCREESKRESFEKIKKLIKDNLYARGDPSLCDECVYEEALFNLYEGYKEKAYELLSNWQPKSDDGFIYVKKGALLSELGEKLSKAIAICIEGLQKIRLLSRIDSRNMRYISSEAWACLIINNLYLAKYNDFSGNDDEEHEREEIEIEQRLFQLANCGYDSIGEYEKIIADLNHEDRQHKIRAAFAWLTLAERCGLTPIISNNSYDKKSYIVAAWWMQFNDSIPRIVNILLRIRASEVLNAYTESKERYTTGWFSAYQVASIKQTTLQRLCDNFIGRISDIVEVYFNRSDNFNKFNNINVNKHNVQSSDLKLLLGLFERFVACIIDEDIICKFAEKLISWHSADKLWRCGLEWAAFSKALKSCIDSVSMQKKIVLLQRVFCLPVCPPIDRLNRHGQVNLNNWLLFIPDILPKNIPENIKPIRALINKVDELIEIVKEKIKNKSNGAQEIIDESIGNTDQWIGNFLTQDDYINPMSCVWSRLYNIKNLKLMPEKQQQELADSIFREGNDEWPLLEGMQGWVAYQWDKDNLDIQLRLKKWLLSQKLRGYVIDNRIHFSGNENEWLVDIQRSLLEIRWSSIELEKVFNQIKHWWDNEASVICQTLVEEQRDSFTIDFIGKIKIRFELIDYIVALMFDQQSGEELLNESVQKNHWFNTMKEQIKKFDIHFLFSDFSIALMTNNDEFLIKVEKFLVNKIITLNDPTEIQKITNRLYHWITFPKEKKLDWLVDTLVSSIALRKYFALPIALQTITTIVEKHADWLDERSLKKVLLGLQCLIDETDYIQRKYYYPDGDEDEIVNVRFYCAKLAYVMKRHKIKNKEQIIDDWLTKAKEDPLPKLRFLEEYI
ncbi:SIR2 family protein [Entomomonas moraniae]|uniref:SIR2 family protein n=1 Tax=Entomomonas moraniae TaxID=2213226 RepID=A0A3Q9JHH3_9GAMM|nr:SIR2 family protein [Entomomonas moraniae]AZS49659.1 SIR2 family protein [Entomomonas moraniae]